MNLVGKLCNGAVKNRIYLQKGRSVSDSTSEAENFQDELGTSCTQKTRKFPKTNSPKKEHRT